MTQAVHQHAYLAALDTAHAELDELLARCKQLQIRKERLEAAAEALKLVFESDEQVTAGDQQAAYSSVESRHETLEPVPFRIQRFEESPTLPKKPIQDGSSDSVQKRINDALGRAAVA